VVFYWAWDGGLKYYFAMNISTKMGDRGETGLFSGERVGKDNALIELLGELDELQVCVGLAKFGDGKVKFAEVLNRIQNDIYRMMGVVGGAKGQEIRDGDTEFLEKEMEKHQEATAGLNKFILPGTTERAARLHLARVVCRRAERRFVSCRQANFPPALKYLNRLSDLLFVLAYINEA